MYKKQFFLSLSAAALLAMLSACNSDDNSFSNNDTSKAKLGEELYNDDSLSRDGNQSCATCHTPEHAFIDDRINPTSHDDSTPGSVSEGQDDTALGDRNTPTASYAAFIPDFHFDASEDDGLFKGGQFLDGRERDLQGQAGQPFLNPVEMQSTKKAVVNKVKEKYGDSMRKNYGNNIFTTVDTAYDAITDSIAKFEKNRRIFTL